MSYTSSSLNEYIHTYIYILINDTIQIDLQPHHCGGDYVTSRALAYHIVHSQLRPLLHVHELVLSRIDIVEFLNILKLALQYSIEYDIKPYDDIEDWIKKYEVIYQHTFQYFEQM